MLCGEAELVVVVLVPAVEQGLLLHHRDPRPGAGDPHWLRHAPKVFFPVLRLVFFEAVKWSLEFHLNKVSGKVSCPPPLVVRPHGEMLHQLLRAPVPVTISNV